VLVLGFQLLVLVQELLLLLQAARATTIREAISRDFFICFP
jgi:hypothetical protein